LSLRRREHLAQDHFGDIFRLDLGTLESGFNRDLAEVVGGQRRESAIESADRCARTRNDDDFFHQNLQELFFVAA
jgi:hypothetical protein